MKNQPEDPDFVLKDFFPYLVRIYYRAVSASVAEIYTPTLNVWEWRTMAVIGIGRRLSASEIVEGSSMDKVNVSRAIAGLRKKGLLKRDIDDDDRRRAVLRLTERGCEVFRALVPQVRQLEEDLLEGLSASERQTLIRLMAKVRDNAETHRESSQRRRALAN